ncbi:MAG: HEAT repeat domain-containing protein [Candidatus Nanopelagicales bacterium]
MGTGAEGTPRQRIEDEVARRGRAQVVAGCVELVRGGAVDDELLRVLGGDHAPGFAGTGRPQDEYWLRVWGARGLLWAADGTAQPAVREALTDEHWRVREMALKVVARHHWGELLGAVAPLVDDPVPRVRAAAARTLRVLTSARD